MSATAAAWAAVAGVLLVLSLRRPVYAVSLYMLTFFAAPHLWWWGSDLPSVRYALLAGFVLLAAVALHETRSAPDGHRFTVAHAAAIAMAVNATFVHFVLASVPSVSIDNYVELLKYVLLTFLIWLAIRNRKDFRVAVMSIALGAAYIGYEVTINERGAFSGSRLEGVGAPGADASNSLASLMLVVLPLAGSLFVHGNRREKVVALMSAPLVLNVLLLCNSRGAFLGLIGAGLSFFVIARGQTRKKAIRALALGAVALYLLLGDPKILDRFTTTFAGSEERDNSATSRMQFWQAGLLMIADYPLGDGGGSFKYVRGARYISRVTGSDAEDRSLHNGYLTEATEWGIQGLLLRLMFVGAALLMAYRTMDRARRTGRLDDALLGLCIISAAAGLLIHSMFGTFLSNEWSYWIVALLIRYSELYRASDAPPDGALAPATSLPLSPLARWVAIRAPVPSGS